MSLNSSTVVRNQIAAPRLFQRLEKQLAKPQGPQVATAIVQVLVDWAHLFGAEELGARSRALLAQPRFGSLAVGCSPSPAVVAMEDEMRLGIPPVAPIRGEDFIRAMYRGASSELGRLSTGAAGSTPRPQPGCLPGGAPPPITTHAVPALCVRMKADAQRLTAALAACRAAARAGRAGELQAALDGGYREAERCSQWRRRVQDFTQQDDNPAALSSVLSATDVINTALREWQDFASAEVYHLMRIVVPPLSAAALRACASSASAAGAAARQPTRGTATQRPADLADLLNMGVAPAQPQAGTLPHSQSATQLSGFDPFGDPPVASTAAAAAAPGAPAGSGHASGRHSGTVPVGSGTGPSANPFANPFAPSAAGGAQPSRPTHQAHPSLSDWDPFKSPSPSHPSGSAFKTANIAALAMPAAPSGGGDWTVFDGDAPTPSLGNSYSTTYSPALTSTMPSGALPSPSNSGPSVTSTPNGGGGGAMPSPRSVAATPQQPTTSSLPPAAATGFSSSPQLQGNGTYRPQGAAAAGAAAASAAAAAPTSDHATALNRSSTAPTNAPAAVPGSSGATSSRNGGPSPPTTLDWRPEFDRLAAELHSLPTPSQSNAGGGGAGAGGGPPLAEVLSRVRGLCEELAAKHSRCVAELTARHAEELRDVKSRSLAKLREVTSAGPAAGAAAAAVAGLGLSGLGTPQGSGPLSSDSGGSRAGAAAAGPGNASSRAGTAGQGPLSQGLQLHQRALVHTQPAQAHKPNGFASAAWANGRNVEVDFSLI